MGRTSVAPIEDEASKLAFFSLNDPGYRLVYDVSYEDVSKLVIANPSRLLTSKLPRLFNSVALKNLLEKNTSKSEMVIEQAAYPEVFFNSAEMNRGDGEKPLFPLSELSNMQGEVRCVVATDAAGDTLLMTIANRTNFDWKFNQGKFPLQVGVHLRSLDGTLLRFDDGLRLSTDMLGYVTGKVTHSEPLSIPRGTEGQIRFPLSKLDMKGIGKDHQELVADFRMVQDGHAWFEHLGYKVVVKN